MRDITSLRDHTVCGSISFAVLWGYVTGTVDDGQHDGASDVDPCLDSRGTIDHMGGVNYQDYIKRSCETSHLVIAEHDKWNGYG